VGAFFNFFSKPPKLDILPDFFFPGLFQDLPMNDTGSGKKTYLTIGEAAAYLKLARQTIRKWVLNKSIPYRKVQKSVRFRLSEIEKWIDEGGGACLGYPVPKRPDDDRERDLFAGLEDGKPGADGNDEETGCPPAADIAWRNKHDGHGQGY
jgi:excisionase family DNA binding protein